jgi:uncharacterized protein
MSEVLQRPLRIELARGWLHSVLDLPSPARAALLLAPPLFHEWQRSYRLFALLADALARQQVAVLRVDYRGSGDSWGEDSELLPSRALQDLRAAATLLEQQSGCRPTVLGVRGGGLIAAAMAAEASHPLWLWQPVAEGAAHLCELRERHRQELSSRWRFPFLRRPPVDDPLQLMGHRLHPEFALELGLLRLDAPGLPSAQLVLQAEAESELAAPTRLLLPPALSDWAGELDISGRFTLPPIRELAQRLATHLPAREAA